MTEYVAIMCPTLSAVDVNASPRAHKSEPTIATFRYENSFSNGPTNSPDRFIMMSRQLMMMAAPVVPTFKSCKRSPNNKPNDGSIERVASCINVGGTREKICLIKFHFCLRFGSLKSLMRLKFYFYLTVLQL